MGNAGPCKTDGTDCNECRKDCQCEGAADDGPEVIDVLSYVRKEQKPIFDVPEWAEYGNTYDDNISGQQTSPRDITISPEGQICKVEMVGGIQAPRALPMAQFTVAAPSCHRSPPSPPRQKPPKPTPSDLGAPVTPATITPSHMSAASSIISDMMSPRPLSTSVNSLEFDELHLEYMFFDPCRQPLQGQLFQKLRLQPDARVEPIRGPIGGCNAGMWTLRDGSQCFMLKLVRILPAFMGPSRTPESEKFAKLARDHPEMVRDPSLSFPFKIFHCLGKGSSKTHDLVVMRWVSGLRFSDFVMHKLHAGEEQELMRALEQFGSFLADFHERYNGLQHGDLTPANVFFDEHTQRFTLVDVSDIAPRNPVIQSDFDRFISGLKLLSNFYGEDLWNQGKVRFEAGYAARRSGGSVTMAGMRCA